MSGEAVDIVIVGGGVVGLACAWLLAERFPKPLLFDAGDLGGGASGVAQGSIGIAPWMSGFDLQWQIAGRDAFDSLLGGADDLRIDRSGVLFVAEDDAGAAAMEQQARRLRAEGHRAEWLDQSGLREVEPALSPDLAGAVHIPDSLTVDVVEFLRTLIRRAYRAGARLFPGEAVQSIAFDRGRIVVRTIMREIAAARVVIAAGFETRTLLGRLGMDVQILPQKGYVLSMPMPPPALRHYVVEGGYEDAVAAGPDLDGGHAIACTLQPVRGSYLRIGSSREFAGDKRNVRPEIVDAIRRRASRFLPSIQEATCDTVEAGLRPWTADNRPLIGPVGDGLAVAAGHNGDGITTALATAVRLADQLTGVAVAPMPEIAPERFIRAQPVFLDMERE